MIYKFVADDRDGFSEWNREKMLWAVSENPRYIVGQMVKVQEFLTNKLVI